MKKLYLQKEEHQEKKKKKKDQEAFANFQLCKKSLMEIIGSEKLYYTKESAESYETNHT